MLYSEARSSAGGEVCVSCVVEMCFGDEIALAQMMVYECGVMMCAK